MRLGWTAAGSAAPGVHASSNEQRHATSLIKYATTVRIQHALAAVALVLTRSAAIHAADAIVRPAIDHQAITGFGASSAWTAPDISDSDANLLFTTGGGVGFTLLRVRIPPGGCSPPVETCELATAVKAQARGATVWATPWSPPAAFKSNGSADDGGTLLPEHADDWANSLVAFVQWMQGQGVTIADVSAQNEPTTVVSYESCVYTPATLTDFIGNHLAPAFAAAKLSTKIVAPETQDWRTFPTFADAVLGNSAAAAGVGVVATHSYGNAGPAPYPAAAQAMKELWQTEVYDPSSTPDPGIASGLRVAVMMRNALVDANVNAWHYWWIRPQGTGNGALWDWTTNAPTKRLYAMGNYSRFVRPGFVRVETTANGPLPGVTFSAYRDPTSTELVIVAINQGSAPVSQDFLFDGVTTGSWTSWVTSATEDSVSSGSPVSGGCSFVEDGGGGADDGDLSVESGGDGDEGDGALVEAGGNAVEADVSAGGDGAGPVEGGAGPVDGGGAVTEAGGVAVDGGCNLTALSVVLEAESVTTFQGFITGAAPALAQSVLSPPPTNGGSTGGGQDAGESSGCACCTARARRENAALGSALAFLGVASFVGRRRRRPL